MAHLAGVIDLHTRRLSADQGVRPLHNQIALEALVIETLVMGLKNPSRSETGSVPISRLNRSAARNPSAKSSDRAPIQIVSSS